MQRVATVMGDRLGVKAGRQLNPLFCFAVLGILLFSSTPLTCNAANQITQWYLRGQLDSLQALWGAWRTSTPHPEINLAGWSSSQVFPCGQDFQPPRAEWRGVECLRNINCGINETTGDRDCAAYITGLTLNNASIVGILPEEFGNISTLTTLELTGNPNLTGALPKSLLNFTNLLNLDLHDNAFYGEIPDLEFLLNLNLGGNQFSGSFPLPAVLRKGYIRALNLGRNNLEGGIPERAFENMTRLVQLDLSSNKFNGTLPTLSTMANLQTLDLSNNRFTGTFPNLTTMHTIRSVNLSWNEFSASALDSWNSSELGALQELYLDNNNFNGTLDVGKLFGVGLFSTRSLNSSGPLRVLSLMNNKIRNVSYDAQTIVDITTVIRLQGNPYCDFPDSDDGRRCFCKQLCVLTEAVNKDRRKAMIIAVVTSALSSLVIVVIVLAAVLHRNKRYKRYLQLQVQQRFEEFDVKPTIFSYNQLRTATRDFHAHMKLGQGAFGAVYKGMLPNGNVVAVKNLFAKSNQDIDEFLNEVVLLTGMKHRNLVNLKGCCIREQQRLLVYKYVDNCDVDKALLANPNKALLSWPVRLRICLGVARGLHYLHALAHPRIIHRDIKGSNILLTKNYESKISDFGLALLFPDEESYIVTKHVAGTKGYLAPEYASYGQLSDKVDVFSFGVLCLEIVSGRRNIDQTVPPDEMYLSKWAWELHRRNKLMDLVDRQMSLQNEERLEVHHLVNVALLCIQNEAEKRPIMERVVAMLQGDRESDAVVLRAGNEEYYVESASLFDFGDSGLGAVKEEGESSLLNSSRQGAVCSEDDVSTGAAIELNEIRER